MSRPKTALWAPHKRLILFMDVLVPSLLCEVGFLASVSVCLLDRWCDTQGFNECQREIANNGHSEKTCWSERLLFFGSRVAPRYAQM